MTLSEIRDINVLISGNAFNPGIYTLNGNSNILHALSMAGGINKYGSYRNILHLRNNEVIGKLDIYNLLISGQYNFETNLKSGDVIFVDTVGNLVELIGALKDRVTMSYLRMSRYPKLCFLQMVFLKMLT